MQLLAYAAQKERESIHQHQAEEIAAARVRDVRFGRKALPKAAKFEELSQQWLHGDISSREAAKEIGVSHTTFLNWAKEKKINKVQFIDRYPLEKILHLY